MDLIVDIGNSYAKLAVFDSESKLIYREVLELNFLEQVLGDLKIKFPAISWAIVSSVGESASVYLESLKTSYQVLELTNKLPVPFVNAYKTPETLGVDRVALVSGALKSFSDTAVLVIDAGTCVTYEFVDAEQTYFGGAISPGLRMRYKAMHTFTENLPLLESSSDIKLTGGTTSESMHSGASLGLIFEIEAYISQYKEQNPDLKVILTGGDAEFLRDYIKSDIFVNSNLLLEGLLHILNYNKEIS